MPADQNLNSITNSDGVLRCRVALDTELPYSLASLEIITAALAFV